MVVGLLSYKDLVAFQRAFAVKLQGRNFLVLLFVLNVSFKVETKTKECVLWIPIISVWCIVSYFFGDGI